jgi:predicted DNA-binding protein (MmcQ/YjbR family)
MIPAVDADALRRLCLGFSGAVEEQPFFKVRGKVFAIAPLDVAPPLRIGLKCDPELAQVLRSTYPAITPGYANGIHWNTVLLDGSLAADFVRDLLEDSYDLVVSALPKRVQRELGWSSAAEDGERR